MRSVRILPLGLFFCACAAFAAGELDQARKLYQVTEYEQSLKLLQGLKEPKALELAGLNYYQLGDYKKATETLEKALAAAPQDPSITLWLGRAYGRRAETSSPFTAMGNASKARQYFEKAVQLDPRNVEALNDLFEYYLEAPGFLGGGIDKAAALAEKVKALDPVEGHWTQAKLAEKRKEFSSAEASLRRAAELAPQQVGRILDLGKFFSKQGRFDESDQQFKQAAQMAPNDPKVLFTTAETWVKAKRNLDRAKTLLEQYIASTKLTPDDPPRADAQKLLRQAQGG